MGAGKSTQIKLIKSNLKKRGLKIKSTHVKTGIIGTPIASFLARILVGKRRDKAPIMILITEKKLFFRRIFVLWTILDLFSCVCKYIVGVCLPIKMGYIILAEDYLPSVLLDYIYFTKLMNISFEKLKFFFKFILRLLYLTYPMHIVFLDADVNALQMRHAQRGDQYEDITYVHIQKSLLKFFSQELTPKNMFLYVNTSKYDVQMTYKIIINQITLNSALYL